MHRRLIYNFEHLGCIIRAILICKKYFLILEALEGRQDNFGEIIITGHPGIGINLLQNDNFAQILTPASRALDKHPYMLCSFVSPAVAHGGGPCDCKIG